MDSNEEVAEINELKKIFSQNILFFRKKLNLSQKELSEKLQTSNKNISKWERAETIPDILTIKKMSKIFNVNVDTLISPISNDNKQAIVTKSATPFKWKIYFLLLVNSIILLLSCVLFFIFKSIDIKSFKLYYIYIYMLPFMDLTVFIFICIVAKKVDPISLSIFGWLVTICFFITFKHYPNIPYIFIITIAYQFIALIFAKLINSRKIIKFNKFLIYRWKKQDLEEKSQKEENISEK